MSKTKQMKVHPAANIIPKMSAEQFAALADDIKKHGALIEPIWTKDGMILDGRNRYRACCELNIAPTFREFKGEDVEGFVISTNLNRRHLSPKQRRELIKKYLRSHPDTSDRTVAEMVGVHHETVGAARAALVQFGALADSAYRTTKDGRQYPSKRKPKTHNLCEVSTASLISRVDMEFHRMFAFIHKLHPSQLTDAKEKIRKLQAEIGRLESLLIELQSVNERT